MRYLLDSEAQPDTCPDAMWVMGVAHPGYAPPPEELLTASSSSPGWAARLREGSSTSTSSPPPRGLGNLFGSSFNIAAMAREPSTPESKKEKPKEVPQWPEQCKLSPLV
jgi:cysteine protease ATG4